MSKAQIRSILFFVSAICLSVTVPIKAYASPPTDFETETLLDNGLEAPTAFDIAPDGRIFIVEQSGNIMIYKNGSLQPRFFDQLPGWATGDNGLLGIAFDPDWNANHYVYFYYIDDSDHSHRVERFDASGDIGTNGPVEIYNSHAEAGFNHAGGTIAFGTDGKLYISVGDAGQSTNSQDLSVPMGKILRINKDGSIPQDNPFVGTKGARPEIWAYGFRNPFRMQFDSSTGKLYEGDVGESTWEEINSVTKGGNYGWPLTEGVCTNNCSNLIDPIYAYHHDTPGYSVTGGPVYHGAMFPAFYQNRLFFGDYARGFIKTLAFDPDGKATDVQDFEPSAGSVVDMKIAPDGSLYYLTIFPGKLFHVTYTVGNKAPKPIASASPASGPAPLTVRFDNSSIDPEGSPLSFFWDFGDGSSSTETSPTKTYDAEGVFTARLVASDGERSATSSPILIQVGTPPAITVSSPAASSTYRAGDAIAYSASATDGHGNSLPTSAFSREVLLHHNTHIHPFLRPTAVVSGSFVIPTVGEPSADTWYEIRTTATDEKGLTSEKSVNILPQKASLSFVTDPPGLSLDLDGQPLSTPTTIEGVVGFQRSLGGPSIQTASDGTIYEFDHWSDGGAQTHKITTPSGNATYTAFFKQGSPFTGQYYSNISLSGDPVLTRDDQSIDFDWGGGSPDPKVPTDGFSVRWTKQQFFSGGTYEFTGTSDDGQRLFVDGNKIIDNWQDQGATTRKASTTLSRGNHEIKMEYYDAAGGAVAKLSWTFVPGSEDSTPTTTPPVTSTTTPPTTGTTTPPTNGTTTPATDYKGEYFNSTDMYGAPALTRSDPLIDFDWGYGSPDPSINSNQFSARWTKDQSFDGGLYRFTVAADDGVKLFLDGALVIDKWFDHPSTSYSVNESLSPGTHNIRMEYYEQFGGAVARLGFTRIASSTPPDADANFSVQYFNNTDLSGTPVVSEQESSIDHIWGYGSPNPLIPQNDFSARWTRRTMYLPGTYKFTLRADDGVRFYVDGNAIVDDWTDHSMRTYTPSVTLTEGVHELKLEYYERAGTAVSILDEH
jgi:glucose/arabinose dehydrogenase/PKD repeat protein